MNHFWFIFYFIYIIGVVCEYNVENDEPEDIIRVTTDADEYNDEHSATQEVDGFESSVIEDESEEDEDDDVDEDEDSTDISGRIIPQIAWMCTDGMSEVVIEGVSSVSGTNGSKIVAIKNGITSEVSMLSKDGTIILIDKPSNPVLKTTKADDINLLLTDNAALFGKDYFYKIRVGHPAKMKYMFGGWNQVFLGCPQPVCIDGRFDALVNNESNVVIAFRGRHFWIIHLNGNGAAPTMANAMLIKTYFPSVDTFLTAATADMFGNIYLFDVRFQIHAYMINMDSLAEALLPGITNLVVVVPVWDYLRKKMFRRKPFYMKQLPNSKYSYFAPTDWRVYYPLTAKNNKEMEIDAAFVTKSKYEDGGYWLWLFNNDKYMAFDFQKVARYALRQKAATSKIGKTELEQYAAKIDPTVTKAKDYYVGPNPVSKLNKQFPIDLESAFGSFDGEVGFSKSWDFFLVPEKLFNAKSTAAFQSTSLVPKGDIFTSLLNCNKNGYEQLGVNNFNSFLQKYKPLLKPSVDTSGSKSRAPKLGVQTVATYTTGTTVSQRDLEKHKPKHSDKDGTSSMAIVGLIACFVVLLIILLAIVVVCMKGKSKAKSRSK